MCATAGRSILPIVPDLRFGQPILTPVATGLPPRFFPDSEPARGSGASPGGQPDGPAGPAIGLFIRLQKEKPLRALRKSGISP